MRKIDAGADHRRCDGSGFGPRVLVFADFRPILQILRFFPQRASAFSGFRIKLQQSSPVRAAALTSDGVWAPGRYLDQHGWRRLQHALGRIGGAEVATATQ